jgi:hypothetical protein
VVKEKIKAKDYKVRKDELKISERLERDLSKGDKVKFSVIDSKILFDIPDGIQWLGKLAFDDVVTGSSSVVYDINSPFKLNPTTNYSAAFQTQVWRVDERLRRSIGKITLPSGSGTISDIKLYTFMYQTYTNASQRTVEIHQLNQDFTEGGATWNTYDGTNSWTGGGAEGDYSATVVDEWDVTSTADNNTWIPFAIYGDDSINPVTLDWEDDWMFLFRFDNETAQASPDEYHEFYCRDDDYTTDVSKMPYLEITYSSGAGGGGASQDYPSDIIIF